jgi:hypothetical protein
VFALYILYEMQMKHESLHRVSHIPICISEFMKYTIILSDTILEDTLEHLCSLAESCEKTFKPHLFQILHHFVSKDTFYILPPSQLKPYNPTTLPHSFILRKDDESLKDKATGKTKAERDRAGRAKWHLLNTWVDERASTSIAGVVTNSVPIKTEEYDSSKADVLRVVSEDVERAAERNVLARLKSLATGNAETGNEGVERLEKMLEKGAGILRNQRNTT